jgi:hypothetical protein
LGAIAAADFFSVEVLTGGGVVRYPVLFVIDLSIRRALPRPSPYPWPRDRRCDFIAVLCLNPDITGEGCEPSGRRLP